MNDRNMQPAVEQSPQLVEDVLTFSGSWWERAAAWSASLWARIVCVGRRAPRRLRLCESLALGERRFVAVVEFEQARFLVGGTSSSLVLLAQLGNPASAGNSDSKPARVEIEAAGSMAEQNKFAAKNGGGA